MFPTFNLETCWRFSYEFTVENMVRHHREGSEAMRAEMLRQGMLVLMANAKGQTAYFAHPFAWAAFFLVGEGGSGAK